MQYIGAIRGPGVVIADMSAVLKYSELSGRCLAILRLGHTVVDENLNVEVVSTSTESIEITSTWAPPTEGNRCKTYRELDELIRYHYKANSVNLNSCLI